MIFDESCNIQETIFVGENEEEPRIEAEDTELNTIQLIELSADKDNDIISDNQRTSTESNQEEEEKIPKAIGENKTHYSKDIENKTDTILKPNDDVNMCQAVLTKVENKKQDENFKPVNDPIAEDEMKADEKAEEGRNNNVAEDRDKKAKNKTGKPKETPLREPNKVTTIDKYLQVPKPIEKTNRAKAGPSTSAVSSKAWRDYYINKDNEKLEKENIKKRKREEIEKRKLEKASKNKKKLKPKDENEIQKNLIKKKVKCAICEDLLESDAEEEGEKNVGCDMCPRWFHLNCTKLAGETYDSVIDQEFYCDFCCE
ncbi:unnamed protein product [Brassicogethes aeneus]|uniref:PHD-type domain-containing protein n=1 Tax=Brassicogethes aeneus TaxID=1431903 RepID=A0A9P0FCF6_BRAAE|nr:unnamed protein product [Brassicogethes aeneus]